MIPDPNKSAVSLEQKIGLSSENSTFSVFLLPNILAIICTFLVFLPASSGWRHTVLELL